ncbi:hypothetical protein GTO89_04690 [Heliobacterium gestii]|uniref:Cell division topological specificity factor n=1 Tax=Heliomicrobium gestii TaxID=2699 RepID=A0A845L7Z1_HELGE|nr:septum formation topological specificity factor MinE [Heliomicrobium gestii]MZP42338.1 hypothetical protein [Heliomicrobium gestii]
MSNFFKSTDLSSDSNQLILVIDDKDAEVTPQFVKALSQDMVDTIAKHIEIDRSKVKINLSAEKNIKKIVIYIPIVNIPRGR